MFDINCFFLVATLIIFHCRADNKRYDISKPQANCDKWKIYFLFQLCNRYDGDSEQAASIHSLPPPPPSL